MFRRLSIMVRRLSNMFRRLSNMFRRLCNSLKLRRRKQIDPLYKPLLYDEIRVIRFLPKVGEGSLVRVELETIVLRPMLRNADERASSTQEYITYEALSYCWGDPQVTRPITINGQKIEVTQNLEAGLRQLQHEWQHESGCRLWVDAICIDQINNAERSSQISLMFRLYHGAYKVHIWLGELNEHAMKGMHVLERLLNLTFRKYKKFPRSELEYWDDEQKQVEDIEALAALCKAPYWKRLWIVQEIMDLPCEHTRNVLHLRDKSFTLPAWHVVFTMELRLHELEKVRKATSSPDQYWRSHDVELALQIIYTALFPVMFISLRALGATYTHATVSSQDKHSALFPISILYLRALSTSDPKDKVYAMLGLFPEVFRIAPNYECSTYALYCEATLQALDTTQSLIMLSQACSDDETLPSWVPDYSKPTRRSRVLSGVQSWYSDGGALLIFKCTCQNALTVNGLVIDTVRDVARSGRCGKGPRRHASMFAAWKNLFEQHCLSPPLANVGTSAGYEAFYKVLHFDLGGQQRPRPDTVRQDLADLEAALGETLDDDSDASDDSSVTPIELIAVERTIAHHDLFVTAAGRLGVVPRDVIEPNDKILVLASARVAFAAREVMVNGKRRYRLRSPCYIEGTEFLD